MFRSRRYRSQRRWQHTRVSRPNRLRFHATARGTGLSLSPSLLITVLLEASDLFCAAA